MFRAAVAAVDFVNVCMKVMGRTVRVLQLDKALYKTGSFTIQLHEDPLMKKKTWTHVCL